MKRKRMRMSLAAAAVLSTFTAAQAASINYGNFGPVPPGITFQSVAESSATDPVPLFGPPAPFTTGIDFDPTSFAASATNGSADITDGQLNFAMAGDITPPEGVAIKMISLFEAGDYTLSGVGTAATQAIAGAIMRVTVLQIDGIDVVPMDLTPVNASVGFNLLANPGVVQPWSLGLSLNVEGQLTSAAVDFDLGATKVEVVIDNTLLALSQSSSVAFIEKKDFRITPTTITGEIVPEPGVGFLFGVGLCMLAKRRRP